jgi:hypothetical protein
MAEIKRFSGDTVFNKPIGVVRPSTAGVQAGQAMAQIGARMFQAGYEQEVIKQKAVGKETAMTLPIRDEDNNLVVKPLPQSLSPVAAQEAQGVIDRRYLEALNLDFKNRAAQLRLEHDKDPQGFDTAFSQYINTTVENAGRYSQQAREMGATYAGQHTAAIMADKLDFEERTAFNNSYTSIVQQIDDLSARRLMPEAIGENSVRTLDYDLNQLVRPNGIIDQLADQYADRISVTAVSELKNRARAQYYGSQLSEIASNVDTFAAEQNPFAPESIVTQQLRIMQDVLRTGRMDKLSQAAQDRLATFGFTQEFLTQDGFARVRNQLASQLANIEGNKEDIFNSARAERTITLIQNRIDSGAAVGPDQAQAYLNSVGLTDAYAIADALPTILKNGAGHATTGRLHSLLMGNGQLPNSVKTLLGDPSVVRDIIARDPNMLPILQNFYRQATTFQPYDPETGVGTGLPIYTDRGLDSDATVFWNTLEAYSNSVRTLDVEGFFAKQSLFDQMSSDAKKDSIKGLLGDDMTLREFVIKSSGADENDFEQINFMSSYADELLLMHGKEKAAQILKSTANQVFTDDKLIFGAFPTIYSPIKIFPNEDERAILLTDAASQLMRSPRFNRDMKAGEDYFLMPDPREGTVFPVYTLVDENGIPFTAGQEVLQVSSNGVLSYRQSMTKKTRDRLIAEAMEQQELILRNRKAFPQQDAFLAGIGTMGIM